MGDAIAVLNAGSSSIKFSLFDERDGERLLAIRGQRISTAACRVSAWAIPTDEEPMIARHTRRVLHDG